MARFSSLTKYTTHLYYPVNKGLDLFVEINGLNQIVVNFDCVSSSLDAVLYKLFTLVRPVLAAMSEEGKARESERFFTYLLCNPRRDARAYLEPLLNYFHILGYLKFKKRIYNNHKQNIVRYKVEYKNTSGETLFVKKYSSLSHLSDDIGKKMTSLHYQLFKV